MSLQIERDLSSSSCTLGTTAKTGRKFTVGGATISTITTTAATTGTTTTTSNTVTTSIIETKEDSKSLMHSSLTSSSLSPTVVSVTEIEEARTETMNPSNTEYTNSVTNNTNIVNIKTESSKNSCDNYDPIISNSDVTLPAATATAAINDENIPMKQTSKNNTPSSSSQKSSSSSSKAKRTRQKSAQSLSNEMNDYIFSNPRTTAYRAASYRPSLSTFQNISFSDYIRGVLLGVEGIEGVDGEEPYYSDDSSDDDDTDEQNEDEDIDQKNKTKNKEIKKEEQLHGDKIKNESKINGYHDKTNNKDMDTTDNKTENQNLNNNVDLVQTCQPISVSEENETQQPIDHPLKDSSAHTVNHNNNNKNTITNTTDTHPANTLIDNNNNTTTKMNTRRMTTRYQTKSIPTPSPEKENLYSKPYYISPRIRQELNQNSNGENKSIKSSTITKNNNHLSNKRSNASSKDTTTSKLITMMSSEPQKLQLDSLKLSDGIGKITPPQGWWDHSGIGNDLTGRGEPWKEGTPLGDKVIPQPIKQCINGIGGVYDFTMMELPSMTVSKFREQADAYRKKQLGEEIDEDETDEHMDLLAKKFWKRIGPTMESSKYGADMEGTLFDGDNACGWNVDQLESCLQLLLADINDKDLEDMKNRRITEDDFRMPGVTSAYLYFGMWASVFCAHTEDMNLLSINYLHAGAPKYWYAISPQDSKRFESLMASLFSHQSSVCKEFLRHKRSLVSPSILTKAGIEYTTQVQRAGDIIITYPGSYHFGFNTGFNVAESTNFAVPEWIPIGQEARVCMCHPHSVRIEMKRFKSLLDEYHKDQLLNLRRGRRQVSYVEWARNLIQSKIKKKQKLNYSKDGKYNGLNGKVNNISSKKGIVVEVMKLMTGSGQTNNKQVKRRKTVSSKTKKKDQNDDDFRLALKLKKSVVLQKKQTPVLCLLEAGGDYHYFAGNIISVIEDYARIHFAGTSKEDDIWMSLDSDMLFFDGGSCEKP